MNEGMENLTQIAELENKVGYAVQELKEILKDYHYKSNGLIVLDFVANSNDISCATRYALAILSVELFCQSNPKRVRQTY